VSFMIHQGDALTVLREFPTDLFDGCLTDPPYGISFMGNAWDRRVPAAATWVEVLRVLKPGAFLLAFGGTRTYHRLTCAIEDAGFEIRDCCCWLYGSGFPKSLDISKAIDKAAGAKRDIGHDAAHLWSGFGTTLKPAWEPIIVAMKPCEGTFAQNALKHGVAGLAIDAGRIAATGESLQGGGSTIGKKPENHHGGWARPWRAKSLGRWPANVMLDESAAVALDAQSGILSKSPGEKNSHFTSTKPKTKGIYGGFKHGSMAHTGGFGDSGGASRFFYVSKASPRERGEDNKHPTVKPLDLVTYLARLILPPERETPRCLMVPFSGSGSEVCGGISAGWDDVIGIEQNAEYAAMSRIRIAEFAPLFLRNEQEATHAGD